MKITQITIITVTVLLIVQESIQKSTRQRRSFILGNTYPTKGSYASHSGYLSKGYDSNEDSSYDSYQNSKGSYASSGAYQKSGGYQNSEYNKDDIDDKYITSDKYNPSGEDSSSDLSGYPSKEDLIEEESENARKSNKDSSNISASNNSKVNNIGEIVNNIEIPASCSAETGKIIKSIEKQETS